MLGTFSHPRPTAMQISLERKKAFTVCDKVTSVHFKLILFFYCFQIIFNYIHYPNDY